MAKRLTKIEQAIQALEVERAAADRRALAERTGLDLAIAQLRAQVKPPRVKKPSEDVVTVTARRN